MRHGKPALAVHGDAIGPPTPAQLDEIQYASFRKYRNLYDAIRPGQSHIEHAPGRIERNSVGAWQLVEQQIQPAVRAQSEHPPRCIDEIGHSLVGEIEIARRRKDQIVGTFERFQIVSFQDVLDSPGRRVDDDDAMPSIGDEETPISMDLQPVRRAVILRNDAKLAVRVHTENPSKNQIDAVQISKAVEGWTLQK